ncbi:MAG: 4Fe-4S dicluster domain-containing protein [Theionarchaea archaeon]|nr:4Fe-4S dicluster domain-containing protein [Theionarchaea archaeon]
MPGNDHRKSGILSPEQIHTILPEGAEKGKIAIIECVEEIPCDPCVVACPSGAISMDSLVSRPRLLAEKCQGCGACIAQCPGLAIFVVDFGYSDDEALVMLPYEFYPLPEKGERIELLDREGEKRGEGIIVKKVSHKNQTAVLSVAVPRKLAMQVRQVRRIE